jgi:hypothetical protein
MWQSSVYLFLGESLEPALHVAFDEEIRWQILSLIHDRLQNELTVTGMPHPPLQVAKTDGFNVLNNFRSK